LHGVQHRFCIGRLTAHSGVCNHHGMSTAKDIQPGQTVRVPRFTNRVVVDVAAVSVFGSTVAVTGRRVTKNARGTIVGPRRVFSMDADATVEVMA
jgi:hypothetical protein